MWQRRLRFICYSHSTRCNRTVIFFISHTTTREMYNLILKYLAYSKYESSSTSLRECIRPADIVFITVIWALIARGHTNVVREKIVRAHLACVGRDESLTHSRLFEQFHHARARLGHEAVHAAVGDAAVGALRPSGSAGWTGGRRACWT